MFIRRNAPYLAVQIVELDLEYNSIMSIVFLTVPVFIADLHWILLSIKTTFKALPYPRVMLVAEHGKPSMCQEWICAEHAEVPNHLCVHAFCCICSA